MMAVSSDIALFGEQRPPSDAKPLHHDGLNAVREGLGLRWLSLGAVEMLRGVIFVVRDENWATSVMEDVRVVTEETAASLRETVTARARLTHGYLDCKVEITFSEGTIALTGTATAHGRLQTNRTGFVILYPETCAGRAVTVEHGDKTVEEHAFPELISPHQPFMDIHALTYAPAPGLTMRCVMEGEVFEMEDQRNWSDASFKVYSRPLARPFPYAIEDGETVRQTIRITVTTAISTFAMPRASGPAAPVRIAVGTASGGRLPRLGIGGRLSDWHLAAPEAALISSLRPALQVAEGSLGKTAPDLTAFTAMAGRCGSDAVLMTRLPQEGAEAALEALARQRPKLSTLALAGATAESLAAARRLFARSNIGVGTDAFFAEFNRKPPPAGADFVFWTVNPTVHAVDDESVMETLRVLAAQAETARRLAPGLPLWVCPLTMRKRFNPNATQIAAAEAPLTDARQQGLFGAAFTLGQIAAWSEAGLDTLVLYQPSGPGGLVAGGDSAAPRVLPPFHVLAGLSSGAALRVVRNDAPQRIATLATAEAVWLANLTAHPVEIELAEAEGATLHWLDERNVAEAASAGATWWRGEGRTVASSALTLGGYSLARVGR